MRYRKSVLFGSALALMLTAPVGAADSDWCEKQWLARSAEHVDRAQPDYAALLADWSQQAEKCRGTGAYEARLAFIHFFLNQPAKAREALKAVSGKATARSDLVNLAELLTDYKEAELAKKVNETYLKSMDNRFLAFVKAHPDSSEGYAMLGALESELGRETSAIQLYEAAVERVKDEQQKWGLYRNLTVGYAGVGRYQNAYDAAGETMGRRKDITSDPYFMHALAKACAGLGRFEDAQNALRLIAAKVPGQKQDPDFRAAVDFVFAEMERAKQPISGQK